MNLRAMLFAVHVWDTLDFDMSGMGTKSTGASAVNPLFGLC